MTLAQIKAELREIALMGCDPFWEAPFHLADLVEGWFVPGDVQWGNDDIDSWFFLLVAEAV